MLTLFYSPHATSVDNEAGRASGHADVPLAALGRQQAQTLGQHYAAEKLDAVFCSDLQRAVVTAEIAFGARNLPIVSDTRLREFDYGQLTQHPRDQFVLEQYLTESFPGGESVFTAVQRVGDFLRDVLRDYDGQTIVVIGHSATKYGIEYWSGSASLAEIVGAPWPWLAVPIWRYELSAPLRAD
jgi:broad specificity phosphatase PhoE